MDWPKLENDFMEYGSTGWIAIGDGKYQNIHNGFIMDENGTIVDQQGNIVSRIKEN